MGFGRQQLAAFAAVLNALGATILFVAGFLIYLTLSTAVVERVRLYGTLQSIGARRSQVRRLVIREALLIGAAATVIGLGLGLGVAAGLIAASRRLFAFTTETTPLVVRPSVVVVAVVLGMVVTLVSAVIPARRAAQLDPVDAMRGDFATQVRLSRAWIAGIIAFTAGAALLVFGANATLIGLAAPLLMYGSVALLPLLLRPVARVVGNLTARLARGVGEVAVLHLAKERTRSGYTLALVMVVMATAVAIGAANDSFSKSLNDQNTVEFGADLQIVSASTFPPGFEAEVQSIDGVSVTSPFAIGLSRILNSSAEPELAQVRFIDPARHFGVGDFVWRDGSRAEAQEALEHGDVIFPHATAERLGLRRGEVVRLRTTDGSRAFRIGATAEISNSVPTMYFSWDVGRRYFGTSNAGFLLVKGEPGADVAAIRETIEDDLGARTSLIVVTIDDIRADIQSQIAGGLNSFYVLLLLAGVLGVVGLTNTMAVSMLQRYREIGLLRAIGARRNQVRGMALVESVTLVAVAFLLAVPLGTFLSVPIVTFSARTIGDLTIHYPFPWKMLPIMAVLGALAALVTAIGPARRATQLDIETALRFE
jgi:putative ABC transport system permease protein